MTAAEMRAWRGPGLLSLGFRPFFLFGALWASLAAPLWAALFLTGHGLVLGAPGRDWHVHEMLFGYLGAVIAGFLLTAVPNWTGRLPVVGWRLAGLVGLWAAARIAMLLQGSLGPLAGAVELLFPLTFAALVWREVLAGRNWRNLPVCLALTLFALADLGLQLRPAWPLLADLCERLALSVPAMLVALVGGRIVPSFTRNWIARRRGRLFPAPFGWIDRGALAVTAIAVLAWTLLPQHPVAGALLLLAGAAVLVRLTRWRGLDAGAEPLVWILHLGYAWLGLGLGLLGFSILEPGLAPRSAGIHALTAGCFGVMTLAVMTRATRGHTGRSLTADLATTAIYLLANAAALARVSAALWPSAERLLLTASGVLWAAAFLGFVLAYGPMLLGPGPRRG